MYIKSRRKIFFEDAQAQTELFLHLLLRLTNQGHKLQLVHGGVSAIANST